MTKKPYKRYAILYNGKIYDPRDIQILIANCEELMERDKPKKPIDDDCPYDENES